ncbi:MAG: 50S ribosomal protein L15 [Ignavibacteriales bacterium]|nr:50S ribosomal protein L15 [Ignavibacteriales bacterium]
MNILSNLKYASGSRKKRKRIGRGEGSGHGGTSTRGSNGQKSRAGAKYRAWFEGGQMPLQRRIPKRGFTSVFKTKFQVINLNTIQEWIDNKKIANNTITAVILHESGLLKKVSTPYKVLGDGKLTAKINIEAHAFSKSAKEKIEAIGGTIKEIKN